MTTIDWIILLIIALYALFGLSRGFVATIADTFGTLFSLVAAFTAASQLKQPVGMKLAPYMEGSIAETMPGLGSAVQSIDETWSQISGYLQGILTSHGISLDVLKLNEDPQKALSSALSQSVGETVAYLLVFIAVFAAARVLIHILASALGIVARLPVIHSFNAVLGGLTGAVTGLLLCTSVLWALKLFVPAVYSDVGLLPPSEMQNSSIARYLVGWNDGVSLFESTPAET